MDGVQAAATQITQKYLLSHGATVLAKLGGPEMLDAEARRNVDLNLCGAVLSEVFSAPELIDAAVDAEKGYLFSQKGLQGSAASRREYHTVLQILGRILGDHMADVLGRSPFREAMDSMIAGQEKLSRMQCERHARELIQQRYNELSLRIDGWDLATHLRALKNVKSAIGDQANRSALGSAFILWLLPLLLDVSSPDGVSHLAWVRDALASCHELPQIYRSVVELRNRDKKGVDPGTFAMPLDSLRRSVFLIWRALGGAPAQT